MSTDVCIQRLKAVSFARTSINSVSLVKNHIDDEFTRMQFCIAFTQTEANDSKSRHQCAQCSVYSIYIVSFALCCTHITHMRRELQN